MSRRAVSVLLALSIGGVVAAGEPPAPATTAESAPPAGAFTAAEESLERLASALAGEWQTTTAKGKTLRVSFQPVSAGSALVERFGLGGRETMTVFHVDGTRLLLTHYCAQGNAPRLRLGGGDRKTKFEFEFVDATNLPDEKKSHLVRRIVELGGEGRFRSTEIYSENGKTDTTVLDFQRVP